MALGFTEKIDKIGLRLAYEKAVEGYEEGGIPIGCALLGMDSTDPDGFRVLGLGHNERMQKSSATLHGEISALENAGRLRGPVYRAATIYTTLSPCSMCTGAILLYKIPRVVIGENKNWMGGEDLLRAQGVEVIVMNDARCEELMMKFIKEKPEEWNEDIGE